MNIEFPNQTVLKKILSTQYDLYFMLKNAHNKYLSSQNLKRISDIFWFSTYHYPLSPDSFLKTIENLLKINIMKQQILN